MTPWTAHAGGVLLTAIALHAAWAEDRPPRVWIVPFENPRADASLAHLEEGLPGLLAVALSRSHEHAVVDRRHVNHVLAELALTLQGLTAPGDRREVGRLLGATVMIGGSVVRQGPVLVVMLRAWDVESGIVTATAEARGPSSQLGQLVGALYRQVARDLGRRLPALRPDLIDDAPVANLHFMRGLGFYHSARPSQALAEFMEAAREEPLAGIARLWLANAYLAQRRYDHAYLELSRLRRGPSANVSEAEVEAKLAACERQLSAEDVTMIRDLAARPASRR